jgi:hypothetical protein
VYSTTIAIADSHVGRQLLLLLMLMLMEMVVLLQTKAVMLRTSCAVHLQGCPQQQQPLAPTPNQAQQLQGSE